MAAAGSGHLDTPPFSRAVAGSAGLWLWLVRSALGWLAHALRGLHFPPLARARSHGILHNAYYSGVRDFPARFLDLWRAGCALALTRHYVKYCRSRTRGSVSAVASSHPRPNASPGERASPAPASQSQPSRAGNDARRAGCPCPEPAAERTHARPALPSRLSRRCATLAPDNTPARVALSAEHLQPRGALLRLRPGVVVNWLLIGCSWFVRAARRCTANSSRCQPAARCPRRVRERLQASAVYHTCLRRDAGTCSRALAIGA